jgi:hypothetical protein
MGNKVNSVLENENYILSNFDRSNWMTSHSEELKDIPINKLRLVGSHNAGSYSISMIGDSYSVCQNTTIYSQLMGGVRYLDLRVGSYWGELKLGHDIHYGVDFNSILGEIYKFNQEHPKELIVIKLRAENKLNEREKATLMTMISMCFSEVLVKKDDKRFSFETCALGDLWDEGKSIILFYDDKLTRFETSDTEDFERKGFWSLRRLYDPWPQTSCPVKMSKKNATYWAEAQDGGSCCWNVYVLQFILTAGIERLSFIKTLTHEIFEKNVLGKFFEKYCDSRLNIIMYDYVFGLEVGSQFDFIDTIINSNF